MKDMLITAPGL